MGIRTSKSPWPTRTFRPVVMQLEDRVVPGEMFGTSMLWAMGAFADPAALMPSNSVNDSGSPDSSAPTLRADFYPPALPYVDASTLTICQVDSARTDDANSTPAIPAPATDTPAAAAPTAASDQAFSGLNPAPDFTTDFDSLSPTSGTMGDILHPGASTPSLPNAPVAAAPVMQVSGLFTAGSAQGGAAGAVPVGNTLSAALSSLANSLNSAGGTSLMTALQSAASTPAQSVAADAGGVATPFAKAHAVAAPDRAHPDAANGAAPFSPAQISQAYGLNLISNTGAGQTIYIVDAYNDPNIASDLATFDSQWGLAAANLTVHKMSSRISNNSSWGVEESLDVEWAHAIAPQANIVLVEATSSSNANLFAAVNYATTSGAKIVSMSWGGSDSSSDSSYDSYFEHSGVTYLASAGDTASAIEYPAASPYVLSVGGTSLTLTTSNGYSSESAWADSGGGISTHESRPGYQTSYGITNSGRSIPDVAWDADPNTGVYVYDSYVRGGGGWYEVGGTSVGAPSWAGVVALADQTRSTPLSTDNLASRTEYNAATGSVYASNYHDITTGSNGHAAGTGYDLVTGVGTPQGNNLVPWLVSNS
jgi:hypothetical protein